jgi:hypothetical protein
MKLESIEHAKFRALAQIMVDRSKGAEVFADYMKVAFPYLEASQRKDKDHYVELLKKEVGRGAIAVSPLAVPRYRSKLKTRVLEYSPETKDLYEKLSNRRSLTR